MPKSQHDDESKRIRKNFATNFRAALAASDYSAADLSRLLKVNPNTVTGYRKGRTMPGGENLVKLAALLRVSVSYLVGDTLGSIESIETLGKDLADRLKVSRLKAATHLSTGALLDGFDRMIGQWIAEHGALPERAARKRPRRKSASSRGNHLHTV